MRASKAWTLDGFTSVFFNAPWAFTFLREDLKMLGMAICMFHPGLFPKILNAFDGFPSDAKLLRWL